MKRIKKAELESIVMEVVHEMLEEGNDDLVRLMMEYEKTNGDVIEESIDKWVSRTMSVLIESMEEKTKKETLITEETYRMFRLGDFISEGSDKDAIRELVLFITNDSRLYHQKIEPIIKNLARKMARDTYDDKLAVKAWIYAVDEGAKEYNKQHGSGKWHDTFNKSTRLAVAEELADLYFKEVEDMSHKYGTPKF